MFSYGEDVSFPINYRVMQLVGPNGYGKSSIPGALEEILYNKNSRGLKKADIPNRYSGKKGYSGYIDLVVNGVEYKVTKVVTSTTKLVLQREGLDISGHTTTQTYKNIEEILGLDFSTFTKLVYQSIGSSLDFLSATDANRKKFLVSLLGLEKYVEAEKTLKEAVKESKSQVVSVQGSVGTIKKWLEENSVVPVAEQPSEIPTETEGLVATLNEKTVESSNIAYHNTIVSTNLKAIATYEQIANRPIEECAFDRAELTISSHDYNSLKSEFSELNTELRLAVKEQSKVAEIKEHCHVCNSKLDVGNKDEMLKLANSEVEILKGKVYHKNNAYESTKITHEGLIKAERDYKAYQSYIAKLSVAESALDSTKPTEVLNQITLTNEIGVLKNTIQTEKRNVASAIEYNQAVKVRNATIDYKKEQLGKFKTDLDSATIVLEEAQVLLAKTEVLASAMGSKGLIAYKIESMVKVFEQLINKYLQVLADGKFALSFAVEDTKLVLNIHKGKHIVDIKSLSSGEFNRVNTATLLAVRKMMTSISKVDINLLFLDEVVSVLDVEGKDTLVELLLKENNLNSVVVSHGYTHPLADVITVVKENDISRLEHE